MKTHATDRRGFALAVAMMAIVVIGALIAGAFFASTQEFRVGRNTLVSQRAFAVAEYGLNSEISNWDRARNLPGGMATGAIQGNRVYTNDGDTAWVTITKLNGNTFWVVSEGQASMDSRQLRSRQRTNAVVRIAYPTVNVRGAVTTAGDVDVNGAATISGMDGTATNINMATWSQCDSISAQNLAGVSVSPTATVNGSTGITGSPQVERSTAAADSLTYVAYGSETWQTLTRNADIRFTTGEGVNPYPIGTDTTCDMANRNNWGEPFRTPGYIVGCKNYFPIIYYDGDLDLQANGRGQGVLLVNGDLRIRGTFDFYGLIIVKDDFERGSGTFNLYGSMMARNATIGDNSNNVFTGTQNIHYSNCAVESALRGSAILTPVRQRGWAQLF